MRRFPTATARDRESERRMPRPRASRIPAQRAVRAAQVLGLLALALVVVMAAVWTAYNVKWSRRIAAETENWRSLGLPLQVSEIIPSSRQSDTNAADIYLTVFNVDFDADFATANGQQLRGLTPDDQRLLADFLKSDERGRSTAEMRALLARDEVAATLDTLRRASLSPEAVFPIRWERGFAASFVHLTRFVDAARLVCSKAIVSAEDGKLSEALDWCETGIRMAGHAGDCPTLIGQMNANAMHGMTLGVIETTVSGQDVNASDTRALRDALADAAILERYDRAMRLEVSLGRATFERIREQPDRLEYDAAGGPNASDLAVDIYSGWLWDPVYAYDMATYMRVAARQYEASLLPWRQGQPVFAEVEREVGGIVFARLTKMLAPVYGKAAQARDASLARVVLCRVALELKAHKARNGDYPDALAQLQRHLAWDIPEDVFSGEPLVYRRSGDGFVLYSVGPDGIDAGGGTPGDDISWRAVN